MRAIVSVGIENQDGRGKYEDEQTLGYQSSGRVEKCKNCRLEIEEVVDDRVVERIQFGTVTELEKNMTGPLLISLSGQLVGKLELGSTIGISGYSQFSVDGGLISKILPNAVSYLQVIGFEPVIPKTLGMTVPQDGLLRMDTILSNLCFHLLTQAPWRHTVLFISVACVANMIQKPIDVLIITDEHATVSKMASILPHTSTLQYSSEFEGSVKRYISKHIEGRKFSLEFAGQLSRKQDLVFIENLKMLRPPELKNILSCEERPGMLACCSTRFAKQHEQLLCQFDLICDHSYKQRTHIDELELASLAFMWHSDANFPSVDLSTDVRAPRKISRRCESLLNDYFIESRAVIASCNEDAAFPIYDPVKQIHIGKVLTSVFQLLRFGTEACRTDALLSVIVQDLNLRYRLGAEVFSPVRVDDAMHSMPSPCPSAVPSITEAPFHGESEFRTRYADFVESIMQQLNLV